MEAREWVRTVVNDLARLNSTGTWDNWSRPKPWMTSGPLLQGGRRTTAVYRPRLLGCLWKMHSRGNSTLYSLNLIPMQNKYFVKL